MAMNTEWHKDHRMPRRPTLGERVRWHVAHAKACGCGEIPDSVMREINKKKARR